MAITISGAGSGTVRQMMAGTLTIKNTNDPSARMTGIRRTEKKAKKPLNYNHREISGQLLRAKKAQSAGTVLTRAKSKLATLQRAAGSGQYSQKEIANAIAHARRMVRCAQLKVRNLREEEREHAAHRKESSAKDQQQRSEVKRRVATKERQLESKMMMEEMQEIAIQKRKKNEMVQKRRMHRSQERSKISEADMKYIKGELEAGRGLGSENASPDAGGFMDLSGTAAAMSELAMMEQQMQAQLKAEMAAEMSGMEMSAEEMSGSAGVGMAGTGGFAGGAETASAVDVSI